MKEQQTEDIQRLVTKIEMLNLYCV
jgi:hypothetical protein